MKGVKGITRIVLKREAEKGERGAIPRVSSWQPGKTYYAGANGEQFVDFVYYDGMYYRCLTTHTSESSNTPYALVQSNAGIWEIENNFEMVATKVAFVGNGGKGWVIDNGVIYHTSGQISLSADGSIITQNGKLKVDENGVLHCKEANIDNSILTDVYMKGTMRSPFVQYDADWSSSDPTAMNLHDNISADGGVGGYLLDSDIPWTTDQNGRTLTIVSYKYNGNDTTGALAISAPDGKFFFEDGICKSKLRMEREFVVLKGYGCGDTFYGWIVIKRGNIATETAFGRQLNVLAQGFINGTKSSVSMTYKTFDGSTLSAKRDGEGIYTITVPSSWNLKVGGYLVMLTGYGYSVGSTTAPIKGTLISQTATSFVVELSDDATPNDGSVMFQIINLNDWI